MKFAYKMLSKYYAEVTPMMAILLNSKHILDSCRKLQLFRKYDKGIDIHFENETFCMVQYQQAFLKYVENEYCAKNEHLAVIQPETILSKTLFPSTMTSGSATSSSDPYDLSCNDNEYIMPKMVGETIARLTDIAACLVTARRLHFNSPPELHQNWGQINLSLNDYHSGTVESSSILWILDITDWWCQQEETHSINTDRSNVAYNIFTVILQDVWVVASWSFGWDVIGWKQWNTTGKTLCQQVIVRQYASANNRILTADDPALHTTNTKNILELKREVEDRKLHRMAKVHNILQIWQGSQILCTTQMKSCAQNTQMTAIEYISGTNEKVKAFWSDIQHDGGAVFTMSARSPLPPAISA